MASCRVARLGVSLLVRSPQKNIERVAIRQVGALLALHLHIAQIVFDCIFDRGFVRGHRRRFRGGNQPCSNGTPFDGLVAGTLDGVLPRCRLAATATGFPPLDEVRAFGMNFDLAVDAHLILEPSVGFRDDGGKRSKFFQF